MNAQATIADSLSYAERRLTKRYFLLSDASAEIVVLDISKGGMRLRCPGDTYRTMEPKDRLKIVLNVPNLKEAVTLVGIVRWLKDTSRKSLLRRKILSREMGIGIEFDFDHADHDEGAIDRIIKMLDSIESQSATAWRVSLKYSQQIMRVELPHFTVEKYDILKADQT